MILVTHGPRVLRTASMLNASRTFSVKELPWCSRSSRLPNNGSIMSSTETTENQTHKQGPAPTPLANNDNKLLLSQLDPIDRFGIVAAMSKNRVIGLNGKLPWDAPNDRRHFKDLTRDSILIVGRKTFHDTPEERNIAHARHCIVVSTTASDDLGSEKVQVARSFSEALHLAKQLEKTYPSERIDCWVCGGEGLYMEALQHKSAQEIQLTVVDTTVEVATLENGRTPEVAMFPAKYRWDRFFLEVSRRSDTTNIPNELTCTYIIYRRKNF